MRKIGLVALLALLAGACSQGGPSGEQDMAEAPSISPTAAPGVAFRYNYAFQLPDEAISAVQEAHAARCEALGPQRCRITGLRYSVSENQAISAMLEVKLAPALARAFGKEATDAVKKADGSLFSTEFTGEDVGPVTDEAGRRGVILAQRIESLERQLASATEGEERAQLQAQIAELRAQQTNADETVVAASTRLASTPMVFQYYGRGGIAGFEGNPIREAFKSFVSSLVTMVTVLLQVLAVLLPWLLLLALLVALARTPAGRALWRFFTPSQRYERDETQ